jgi:hypothetical protein
MTNPERGRRHRTALWVAAVVLTVALGAFQRLSGPTYPLRGEVATAWGSVAFRLPRAHAGAGPMAVRIRVPQPVDGTLEWRRWPTEDPWSAVPMTRDEQALVGRIPHQPAAGKVEYRIKLRPESGVEAVVPDAETVIARFRTSVPAGILIPHILAMFGAMLMATRAMLEVAVDPNREPRRFVLWAMGLLLVGGLVLGPLVQRAAFGALWTGWPVGTDLTDNKTALAVLAWLPATVVALRRRRGLRWAVLVGWVVMMSVFLIPHSLRGSQIDWESETEVRPVSTAPADPLLSWTRCPGMNAARER